MRPDLSLVAPNFHNYINRVQEDDLFEAFEKQSASFIRFMETIPVEKRDFRYAPEKWTIQEVLQHIVDAERIFAYRALRFSRKDTTPLPGFDENAYVVHAKADTRSWDKIMEEFKVVRRSSELLFLSFDEEQLQARGISSNSPNYVLALGFILIGHSVHHMEITRERYL